MIQIAASKALLIDVVSSQGTLQILLFEYAGLDRIRYSITETFL